MKKYFGVILVLFVFVVALQSQGPGQQQNQMTAEEVQRALSLVEKSKTRARQCQGWFGSHLSQGFSGHVVLYRIRLDEGSGHRG